MFDYGKTESALSAVACLPCGWEWKAELHQNSCLTALLGRYKSIHLKSHTVCWKLRTAVWRSALLQFELLHISDTLYRICFMYTCSLFPCHVMFGSTHPQKSKIHSSLLLNTLNTAQNVCSHIYSTQSLKPELFRQNITYESVCYYKNITSMVWVTLFLEDGGVYMVGRAPRLLTQLSPKLPTATESTVWPSGWGGQGKSGHKIRYFTFLFTHDTLLQKLDD